VDYASINLPPLPVGCTGVPSDKPTASTTSKLNVADKRRLPKSGGPVASFTCPRRWAERERSWLFQSLQQGQLKADKEPVTQIVLRKPFLTHRYNAFLKVRMTSCIGNSLASVMLRPLDVCFVPGTADSSDSKCSSSIGWSARLLKLRANK
jgi:hypothetical protein